MAAFKRMAEIKLAFQSRTFSRPDHVHRGELRRSFVVATDPLLSIGFVHSRLTEPIPDDSSCLQLSLSQTQDSPVAIMAPLASSPAQLGITTPAPLLNCFLLLS